MTIDHTHDPAAKSWVEGADNHSEFPIQNLPLGIFSQGGRTARPGVAIGDQILDLAALARQGHLTGELGNALNGPSLNALFALPVAARTSLRHTLFALLGDEDHRADILPLLKAAAECKLHVPAQIGDYTDFYVGIHHATNIGRQFRPDNPLLPNYKYVPIGYHGRASSIRASGEPVRRPSGQRKPADASEPEFGASCKLDYELELGIWIAGENQLGEPVPISSAKERIAGLCLLNDWSARDIQAWEYQPLGPFNSKNFLTTISPWVVTAEALAPFRVAQAGRPDQDPVPLPYLSDREDLSQGAFSIQLEVHLQTAKMRDQALEPLELSRGPATNMYWTAAQMVAHHASGGCNLKPGDLLGTGTISGPERGSFGSLMEISEGGKLPIELASGETRGFLENGDELSIRAHAMKDGFRTIGFGECVGTVV